MMNSASLATGSFSGATGFYGNVLWQPTATGNDSTGKPVDFRQPVFSEDLGVLDALKGANNQLLDGTLFSAAQAAGMVTATIGKTGAAYLMDTGRGGLILDERAALPLGFARELQAAGVALPPTAPGQFSAGEIVLAPDNGNPVEHKPVKKLADGVSTDPEDAGGTPYRASVDHLINAYLEHVLPEKRPRLSVLWLRDPDTTQHQYGIGSPNWHAAVRSSDEVLGRVLAKLDALGRRAATDIIVVSDHGHSNVSGPQDLFPLRTVRGGALGDIAPNGHSTSGMVRIADLMRRAGFTVFDGLGCTMIPIATGIRRDGSPVYPTQTDRDGSVCGKEGQRYQAPASKVPAQLPPRAIVVAVNGGSDYLYVPDHDRAVIEKAVIFLQSRVEVGAIFVDDRYGKLAGTLPLSAIRARNAAGKNPDIIFSYDYDENAMVEGVRGTEMAGVLNGNGYRGMHGSFSPMDVHNTLIAAGPDFRTGFKDPLPSGNVDVAPTVARILGLSLPGAQGRPLLEALVRGAAVGDYRTAQQVQKPFTEALWVTARLPTDPDGKDVVEGVSLYSFDLHTRTVSYGPQTYTYYDFAKAWRR
jgi:arylsulfatase A-like enzyme